MRSALAATARPSAHYETHGCSRKAKILTGSTIQFLGEHARAAYERSIAKGMTGKWEDQYVDEDVRIQVKNGYSHDHLQWTTEITVSPRKNNPRGSHQHVVFDERGREIYNEWREK